MRLTRTNEIPGVAMFGVIDVNGTTIHTLERPWVPCTKDNVLLSPCGTKGISCVPPGVYKLEWHQSEAHSHTVALVNPDLWVYHYEEDVPPDRKGFARTCVLVHPANWPEELRGCIAPGMSLSKDPPGVLNSRTAFDLLKLTDHDTLEIVNEVHP